MGTAVGRVTLLEEVRLGNITAWLCCWFRSLALANNRLVASIPTAYVRLSMLVDLELQNNALSGGLLFPNSSALTYVAAGIDSDVLLACAWAWFI